MNLRRAGAEDAGALARLEASAFADPWSLDLLSRELDLASCRCWVLPAADGTLVAYATYRVAANEAELLRIAVAPGARRTGVGEGLFRDTLDRLGEEGFREVHLEVRSDNLPGRALYEKVGFEEAGSRRRYYRDGTDAILYRLRLPD